MGKDVEYNLGIPFALDKPCCFAFEYLIEDTPVFEIKVLYGNKIVEMSPKGNVYVFLPLHIGYMGSGHFYLLLAISDKYEVTDERYVYRIIKKHA